MKKIILLVLLAVGLGFAQTSVWTSPQYHGWVEIFNGILNGADGCDTTTAISLQSWSGTLTLAIETDTTGASVEAANQSDSCLTVGMQFYCASANIARWGSYYEDTDTYYGSIAEFTRIDTLGRAKVNRAAGVYFIDIQYEADQLAWADSIRFLLNIGATDSLKVVVSAGGQ